MTGHEGEKEMPNIYVGIVMVSLIIVVVAAFMRSLKDKALVAKEILRQECGDIKDALGGKVFVVSITAKKGGAKCDMETTLAGYMTDLGLVVSDGSQTQSDYFTVTGSYEVWHGGMGGSTHKLDVRVAQSGKIKAGRVITFEGSSTELAHVVLKHFARGALGRRG